jgi:S1-C subfamily serine protease
VYFYLLSSEVLIKMLLLVAVLSFLSFQQGLAFTARHSALLTRASPRRFRSSDISATKKVKEVESKADLEVPDVLSIGNAAPTERELMMKEMIMELLEKMEPGSGDRSLSSDQTELLNGVVRIYCTHSQPNFGMPWQRMKQEFSTSTGFVIDGNRILTNAHAVEYGSLIQVKKRSSEKKYVASVIAGENIL